MEKKIIGILKYVLGVGLGALLLYFAFEGVKWEELVNELKTVRYSWLLFSISIGLSSHFFRALRWRMQFRASGYNPSTMNTFASVMVMYLVNLALPRAGELARCSVLLKSDKIPLSSSFGTVMVERVFDLIILLGLTGVAFLLEFETIYQYMVEALGGDASAEAGIPAWIYMLLGGGVVGGLMIFFVFKKQILSVPIIAKAFEFVQQLVKSALSIRNIENPFLFLFYTVIIWVGYWLMTYVAFYSMPIFATLDLDLVYFSLLVTIIGSIGFAMPVPGGLGPYHAAVMFTFVAFSVLPDSTASENLGRTFAIVLHTTQLVMMIVVGALGYFYLWLQTPKDSSLPDSGMQMATDM